MKMAVENVHKHAVTREAGARHDVSHNDVNQHMPKKIEHRNKY